MRKTSLLALAFCSVLAFTIPALAGDAQSGEDNIRLVLRSAPFNLVEGRDGRKIEMRGFEYLKQPGRPMLPEKEMLVLLPPGARLLSLEIEGLESKPVPGRFRIAPTPPLLPLAMPDHAFDPLEIEMAKWQETYRASYAADGPYPGETVRIVGTGSLRKYSYVRVAFRPFTYHPASGRLVQHDEAVVRIDYELSDTEGLLSDSVADQRAAELFVNYDELKSAYGGTTSRSTLEHHDYVIITTSDLAGAITASNFPGWKTTLGFDLRTVLTTDPEITEQPGVDLAERIRNFLRANYGPWGIEYVLLVGDYEDVPMRYCYPDPENHLHDPSNPGVGPGSVPTDHYYADLSLPDAESWDSDGDGFHGELGDDNPDFLAEVSVGRIPTSSGPRITYTLDKLVRVEQDTGAWKRQALHAGAILFFANQNGSGIPLRDGATCVDEIEKQVMGGWTMSRYSEQTGLVTSPYPWPQLTLQDFFVDWSTGTYGFVNWGGHGWPDGVGRTIWSWDDGDGVPETDGSDGMDSVYFITNGLNMRDDYPSIVCAVSCDVGYPDPNPYGNIGIDLLVGTPIGFASAVVSSSRYAAVSGDWPANPGGAESLCYEFNRYAVAGPGGPRRLGDALYESKFFTHFNYGWSGHYEYRNMYNYNLYGDPAMDWRGAPLRTADLLRNTDVTQLDPLTPPLDGCLPMNPVEDQYIPGFMAGDVDPDSGNGSPLVFYALDSPALIWMEKTASGEVRIDF